MGVNCKLGFLCVYCISRKQMHHRDLADIHVYSWHCQCLERYYIYHAPEPILTVAPSIASTNHWSGIHILQARIQGGGGGQGCLGPPIFWNILDLYPGGGGGPPLSESLGIDFYSGFRKKIQVYTFIVASEKKKHKGGGGVQFEILRNPGINSYSGFRKKSRYTLLEASEKKKHKGGGGGWCNSKS